MVVQLLCDLAEATDEIFRESMIDDASRAELQFLTELGALKPGPRPTATTCSACDEDHSEPIEYDGERKGYVHFCRSAGIVPVAEADLVTHEFQPEWLAQWLMNALPVNSPHRLRPALLPKQAWHLGDTKFGSTVITVVFTRRIATQRNLDLLASALRPIYRADKGLVVTTSLNVARQVALPGGYELLPLPEIVSASPGGLSLDTMRLGSWIRSMQPTTGKGAPTRVGRPSPAERISQIYNLRRSRGLPVKSDSAEAQAILEEWRQHVPDEEPPGRSTARRHVSRLTRKDAPR